MIVGIGFFGFVNSFWFKDSGGCSVILNYFLVDSSSLGLSLRFRKGTLFCSFLSFPSALCLYFSLFYQPASFLPLPAVSSTGNMTKFEYLEE